MIKRLGILATFIFALATGCSSGPGGTVIVDLGGGDIAVLSVDGGTDNLSGTVTVRFILADSVSVTEAPILLVDGLNMGPMVPIAPGSQEFTLAIDTTTLSNAIPHILQALYAPASIARTITITVFNLTPSSGLNIAAPLANSVVKGSTVIQVQYPPTLLVTDLDYYINGVQLDKDSPGTVDDLTANVLGGVFVVPVTDCALFLPGMPVRVFDDAMAGTGTVSRVVSCVSGVTEDLTLEDATAEPYQTADTARVEVLGECPEGGTIDPSGFPFYAVPFCIWDAGAAAPGSSIITVVATHAGGTATASVPVTVQSPGGNEDLTPPIVGFVSPLTDEVVSGNVNLRVTADDDHGISSVSFSFRPVGGGSPTPIGNAVQGTGNNWSLPWDTGPVLDGAYEILGIATDFSNNSGLSIQPVVIDNTGGGGDVNVDPPCVIITNPSGPPTPVVSGVVTILADSPVDVTVDPDCGDNVNIAQVDYYLNGVILGSSTNGAASYAFLWTTTQSNNATFMLSAIATDTDGNESVQPTCGPIIFEACVEVEVDNGTGDFIPPVVNITDPLTGAVIAGTYTIVADATDNVGVLKVEFFANGVLIPGCIDTNLADGATCTWDTSVLPSGSVDLTAKATDTSGNVGFTAPVTVSVVKALPPELLTRESDVYVSQYNALNPQAVPIVVNSTAVDGNSPEEPLTFTWNFGDGSGLFAGCCGQFLYTTFDPFAPNYLVEVRVSNQSGFSDNTTPDGATHFFFIATAQQLWDLQNVAESEACQLDWPSGVGDPPCTPSADPPRQDINGNSIVIRNILTANAQSNNDEDFRGKVILLQIFSAACAACETDQGTHLNGFFTGPDYDPAAVEIISLGLEDELASPNVSFADAGELANYANSRGFNWTFVWDENNVVNDMYEAAIAPFTGSSFLPKYIIMDRNHYIEFADQGVLNTLLQGQTLSDFISGLSDCFGNPACTPTF